MSDEREDDWGPQPPRRPETVRRPIFQQLTPSPAGITEHHQPAPEPAHRPPAALQPTPPSWAALEIRAGQLFHRIAEEHPFRYDTLEGWRQLDAIRRQAHAADARAPDASDTPERERQARAIDALAASHDIPAREYTHAGYPFVQAHSGQHRPVPGSMPMQRDELNAWQSLYARADALQQESLHSPGLKPKQQAACADLNSVLKLSAAILQQATPSRDAVRDHERDALGRDLSRGLAQNEQILAVYAVRVSDPAPAHRAYWEQRHRESSAEAQREARSEHREATREKSDRQQHLERREALLRQYQAARGSTRTPGRDDGGRGR
jgi:hypothetical protein